MKHACLRALFFSHGPGKGSGYDEMELFRFPVFTADMAGLRCSAVLVKNIWVLDWQHRCFPPPSSGSYCGCEDQIHCASVKMRKMPPALQSATLSKLRLRCKVKTWNHNHKDAGVQKLAQITSVNSQTGVCKASSTVQYVKTPSYSASFMVERVYQQDKPLWKLHLIFRRILCTDSK